MSSILVRKQGPTGPRLDVAALEDHGEGAPGADLLVQPLNLVLHQAHERTAFAAHATAAGQHRQRTACTQISINQHHMSATHMYSKQILSIVLHAYMAVDQYLICFSG